MFYYELIILYVPFHMFRFQNKNKFYSFILYKIYYLIMYFINKYK